MGNALKNKNIGLVTYSNSDNYFRQNWLDVLRNEFDNFFHLELDMNFNLAQKQKVISGFIKDNNLDLLIITIGHSVFHPAFYHNLNVNLLFYFTDDDWTFDMRTRFMCQYANIVVTPNQDLLAKYKPYNRNVFHMTWAGNPYLYKKINCEKKYDVTSIGAPHSDRYEVLKFLRDNGVNLRIFGRGWNRYPDMKDIWGGYLAPEDLVKTINQSKINLSFLMASIMDRYHITGRFFEIPCAGGFQLCDDYFEVYKYYKRDSAISTFSTKDDLLKKIYYYLKNEEEREEIAQAGYERTMEEYTWNKRFENLFKAIDESGDEVFKMPDPYISKKNIAILYSPKSDKIESNVIESINAQTLPDVTLFVVSDSKVTSLDEIKYPCKTIFKKDIKKVELEGYYLSYIEDGDQWEPEKLQFQAFALEEDEKEGIYTNFAGWGVYRGNQKGEFATYFLRWLREYAGEDRLVKDCIFPSCLMFNLSGFSKNDQRLLIDYVIKNNSILIEKIFSDKKAYKYIDIGVSLVRITEKRFWNLLTKLNSKDKPKVLRGGMKIDLKRYLSNLALRFGVVKVCYLLRIYLRKEG